MSQYQGRIKQRRGTAERWAFMNPKLSEGEIGYETDTGKFKIGNGKQRWNALPYFLNQSQLEDYLETLVVSPEDPRVGELSELSTTEKTTIVGAINEVNNVVVPFTLLYENAKA